MVATLLGRMVATSAWTLAELGQVTEAVDRPREGEQLIGPMGGPVQIGSGSREPARISPRAGAPILARVDQSIRVAAPRVHRVVIGWPSASKMSTLPAEVNASPSWLSSMSL